MSIVITEILGTDAFSASRLTINANFTSLKSEVEAMESSLGISTGSGNIDVSLATGGQIKGKVGAFNTLQLPAAGVPTITLTGTTGAITATSLSLTTINATTINVITGGTFTNQGSSVFDGQSTFNDLVKFTDGEASSKIDVGVTNTHTVLNTDNKIIFDGSGGPATLTLTADPSLVDGHIITLISKGTGACVLVSTNILGFSGGSITFNAQGYKSAIVLMYSLADLKWIIINSSNMVIT